MKIISLSIQSRTKYTVPSQALKEFLKNFEMYLELIQNQKLYLFEIETFNESLGFRMLV